MKIDKIRKYNLLPIIRDLIDVVKDLTLNFCYEFDLTKTMIVEKEPDVFSFILANQHIPVFYRQEWLKIVHEHFQEDNEYEEYELNDKIVLRKLASFLVTIATGKEPTDI